MPNRTAVLNNITLLVNGMNLSGACNEATVNYSAEMLDATTFGCTTRVRRGGLTTMALALKGFDLMGSSCSPENVLQPIVGSSGTIFAFFPSTITGCTECGYAGRGIVEAYNPGGAVGTIIPFTAALQSAGKDG